MTKITLEEQVATIRNVLVGIKLSKIECAHIIKLCEVYNRQDSEGVIDKGKLIVKQKLEIEDLKEKVREYKSACNETRKKKIQV